MKNSMYSFTLITGILLVMLLSACAPSQTVQPETLITPAVLPTPAPTPTAKATPAATPKPTAKPTATPAPVKRTTITAIVSGGTEKQQARMLRIAKAVEPIINSEKFKARVLGASVNGKLGFNKTSLTNKQVYDRFMAGDELKKGKPDNVWQLKLLITLIPDATSSSGAPIRYLGMMSWGNTTLKFNSKYLDGRKDSGLAGTLCHEYAHLLGFVHADAGTSDTNSVPYAIGNICAEIYSKP